MFLHIRDIQRPWITGTWIISTVLFYNSYYVDVVKEDLLCTWPLSSVYRPAYVPKKALLDRTTNEVVKTTTKKFHAVSTPGVIIA